ncbi:MAG: GntR family transcriptional regulator [Candidatus Neomarinimicrobiota bacterium]
MQINVSPNNPLPLYHQIAAAISVRIANGRLSPGETLPSVRRLAKRLGVNLHTVRRAYIQLSGLGLVESLGPRGTKVAGTGSGGSPPRQTDRLEQFLQGLITEAREQFDLTQADLAQRLWQWAPPAVQAPDFVHIIECSEQQCRDHAGQIEAHWQVEALGWSLEQEGEAPPGPAIATYFHYNEIRRRWPHRFNDIQFVSARPDPGLKEQIVALARFRGGNKIAVCEYEEQRAANIAADLRALFVDDNFEIDIQVVTRPNTPLHSREDAFLVYPPRVWAALSTEERADPRVFKLTYVLSPEELQAVGEKFNWRQR